jgi:DNA-binding transcriptional ArsR family regulator
MASTPAGPGTAEDTGHGRLIKDAVLMRALAHPARISIVEHLGQVEAATATECAEVVGLSPSATSYHLRALAKAGLIEDAPGRGDGRERVWRAVVHGYTVRTDADADPETKQAERELIETFLTWEDTRVRRALARIDQEPREGSEASFFSEVSAVMTADELRQFGESLQELVKPYKRRYRTDPPEGVRAVSVQLRGFPSD